MKRRRLAVTAAALVFLLLLAYATLRSLPGDTPAGPAAAVEPACRDAVARRVVDARFPFPGRLDPAEPGVLRGVVDSGEPGALLRRNFECRFTPGSPAPRIDSIHLWQSH